MTQIHYKYSLVYPFMGQLTATKCTIKEGFVKLFSYKIFCCDNCFKGILSELSIGAADYWKLYFNIDGTKF